MRPACRPTPAPPTRGDDHERCCARLDTLPPCTDIGWTASPVPDLVRTRRPWRRRRRDGVAVRRPAVDRRTDDTATDIVAAAQRRRRADVREPGRLVTHRGLT